MRAEELYEALLPLEVVNFDEIAELASRLSDRRDRAYINTKYVQPLVRRGRLRRLRRGIYFVSTGVKGASPDKILVASKVRKRYYLGYHTALELHGCAYSAYNTAYVCVRHGDGFREFAYDQYLIKPVFSSDIDVGVGDSVYRGHNIRVSSRERTFLDCLDRVEYAGGWEEALKSLESMSGLMFAELVGLVAGSGNRFLIQKTGFVLELLKSKSIFYEHVQEDELYRLQGGIGGQTRYLVEGEPGELNKRWRLYVPKNFEEYLRGV